MIEEKTKCMGAQSKFMGSPGFMLVTKEDRNWVKELEAEVGWVAAEGGGQLNTKEASARMDHKTEEHIPSGAEGRRKRRLEREVGLYGGGSWPRLEKMVRHAWPSILASARKHR